MSLLVFELRPLYLRAVQCDDILYYIVDMSEAGALPIFLIGSVVHGCFGKTAMITMAANSYVTDITDAEKRTKKLGFLAAMQMPDNS
jgi:hypothetical protein